jgi:hypothetical protein
MHKVDLFAEDQAHELFVSALVRRVIAEEGGKAQVQVRSAVGGHGRALTELKTYQRAIRKGAVGLEPPDLVVVAIDANCKGLVDARNDIQAAIDPAAAGSAVLACPDPHIERWFFADGDAFARVVGVDQQPGKRKCERDRYKAMLKDAVTRAGHFPTLGGLEFANDLVKEMDLYRAGTNEPSLAGLIDGIRAFVKMAKAN